MAGEAWVHNILAWVKKNGVSGVGRTFGVGCLGLRCFVKRALLKVSQNLQENTCVGVSR